MLREVVRYLRSEEKNDPQTTLVWATARSAQARLYEKLGFTPTGDQTPDGMLVLNETLAKLTDVNIDAKADPLPLMTAEEQTRLRQESKRYSVDIRAWYRVFWMNEERLAVDPDREANQWTVNATMRPAPAIYDDNFISTISMSIGSTKPIPKFRTGQRCGWVSACLVGASGLKERRFSRLGANCSAGKNVIHLFLGLPRLILRA